MFQIKPMGMITTAVDKNAFSDDSKVPPTAPGNLFITLTAVCGRKSSFNFRLVDMTTGRIVDKIPLAEDSSNSIIMIVNITLLMGGLIMKNTTGGGISFPVK
jgi:hypothetical protein